MYNKWLFQQLLICALQLIDSPAIRQVDVIILMLISNDIHISYVYYRHDVQRNRHTLSINKVKNVHRNCDTFYRYTRTIFSSTQKCAHKQISFYIRRVHYVSWWRSCSRCSVLAKMIICCIDTLTFHSIVDLVPSVTYNINGIHMTHDYLL